MGTSQPTIHGPVRCLRDDHRQQQELYQISPVNGYRNTTLCSVHRCVLISDLVDVQFSCYSQVFSSPRFSSSKTVIRTHYRVAWSTFASANVLRRLSAISSDGKPNRSTFSHYRTCKTTSKIRYLNSTTQRKRRVTCSGLSAWNASRGNGRTRRWLGCFKRVDFCRVLISCFIEGTVLSLQSVSFVFSTCLYMLWCTIEPFLLTAAILIASQ